jgi:hypothetical protein
MVRSKLETNRFRREKYLHWETTPKPDMVGARHCASYMRGIAANALEEVVGSD